MNELRIDLDPYNAQHRQFGRLVIAEDDIRKARETALLVVERLASIQDELFDPLSCATVIWYARPFTQAKEYPAIPKRYTKFSSRSYQKVHDRLSVQRNLFEAHIDKSATEVFLIRKAPPVVHSHSHFIATDFLVPRAFPGIVKLCDFQLERLGGCHREIAFESREAASFRKRDPRCALRLVLNSRVSGCSSRSSGLRSTLGQAPASIVGARVHLQRQRLAKGRCDFRQRFK